MLGSSLLTSLIVHILHCFITCACIVCFINYTYFAYNLFMTFTHLRLPNVWFAIIACYVDEKCECMYISRPVVKQSKLSNFLWKKEFHHSLTFACVHIYLFVLTIDSSLISTITPIIKKCRIRIIVYIYIFKNMFTSTPIIDREVFN